MTELVVPVDDASLALITEALNVSYDVDEQGNHTLVGGTFTLDRLLEFWSGYDESLEQDMGDNFSYYPYAHLSHQDIIRALIDEIHRLRDSAGDD